MPSRATIRSAANKSRTAAKKKEQKRNSLRRLIGFKKQTQVAPVVYGTAKGVKRRRRKSTKKRARKGRKSRRRS